MTRQKQRYRECVVTEAAHVPPEYLPLGDFHDTETTLHRYLVKQCENGSVKRFRLGRLLYVHKDHIEEARQRYESRSDADARRKAQNAEASRRYRKRLKEDTDIPSDLQYESVCESLADIAQSAAGIERLLERLTTAVESIATQPKQTHDEPVGSWRDMNGEAL